MEIKEIAKKYNKPVNQFIKRADGCVDWTCSHGIRHTVFNPNTLNNSHICPDGCCKELKEWI